jgi:hypothetical protein
VRDSKIVIDLQDLHHGNSILYRKASGIQRSGGKKVNALNFASPLSTNDTFFRLLSHATIFFHHRRKDKKNCAEDDAMRKKAVIKYLPSSAFLLLFLGRSGFHSVIFMKINVQKFLHEEAFAIEMSFGTITEVFKAKKKRKPKRERHAQCSPFTSRPFIKL